MKLLFIAPLFLAFISFSGCKKSPAPAQQASTTATPSTAVQQQYHVPEGGNTPTGETKYFKGSVGNTLGLQMKLIRDGERLSGNYFYRAVGTKVELKGTVDPQGNVMLEEFDANGKQTGVFKGLWKAEDGVASLAGNWSRPNSEKKVAFSLHEEPIEFSGGAEIVAKKIKVANDKLKYKIEAAYPEVTGASDGRFGKFNQEAKNLVTKKVTAFKKEMVDSAKEEQEGLGESLPGSDLSVDYTIALAGDNQISVKFDIGSYSRGAAHPNAYTEVLNYDVKAAKVLRLGDLFKPGSKYLQAISSYCVKDLKKQSKAQGANSVLSDDTIASGASADPKNYHNWAITKQGLDITFDAYQVGPYAAGPKRVTVPYSALKDLVKPDGPLGRFVK